MQAIEVEQCIRYAWQDVEYSVDVDSELNAGVHPEDCEVRKAFVGRRWEDIPESTLLVSKNPGLLGEAPLRYFLPAFLIAALRESNEELLDYLIEFFLRPPKKQCGFVEFCRRFDQLSEKQRFAVATFLQWARDSRFPIGREPQYQNRYYVRAIRRINDALNRYWCGSPASSDNRRDGPPVRR